MICPFRTQRKMSLAVLTEDFKDGVQVVLYMMKSQTTIIAGE